MKHMMKSLTVIKANSMVKSEAAS